MEEALKKPQPLKSSLYRFSLGIMAPVSAALFGSVPLLKAVEHQHLDNWDRGLVVFAGGCIFSLANKAHETPQEFELHPNIRRSIRAATGLSFVAAWSALTTVLAQHGGLTWETATSGLFVGAGAALTMTAINHNPRRPAAVIEEREAQSEVAPI